MRDVDHRRLETLVETKDLGAGLDPQLGIEVGKRLVHEEHLRLPDDGPAQRHPLPLPAGEGPGPAVEGFSRPRMAAASRTRRSISGESCAASVRGQVVVDRHVRVEGVALEHHRDVAVLGDDVVHDPVADPQLPLADGLQAGHTAQGGGLPATGRTNQDQELAVIDLQVEVVDSSRLGPKRFVTWSKVTVAMAISRLSPRLPT